jgi:hypothetical protein
MKGRMTGNVEGITEKEGVREMWQSITRHEGRISRKEGMCACGGVCACQRWGACVGYLLFLCPWICHNSCFRFCLRHCSFSLCQVMSSDAKYCGVMSCHVM